MGDCFSVLACRLSTRQPVQSPPSPSYGSFAIHPPTFPTLPIFLSRSNRQFWPAVHGSWVVSFFFCPVQFLTFRYLPLEFRVLSVNVGDIAWTSVLSYFSHKGPSEADYQEKMIKTDGGGSRKRASGGRKQREMVNGGGKGAGTNSRKGSGSGAHGRDRSTGGIKGLVGAGA